MNPFLKKKAIGIPLVTIAMFLLLEASIRLFAPQGTVVIYETGVPVALQDRELGFVLRPGSICMEKGPEFNVTYVINSDGMRTRWARAPGQHVREGPRILLMGDSFAYGAANDYTNTWVYLLEESLNSSGLDCEIINAGVPAYDTRQQLLYINRIHDHYHPELVLLGFLPNDVFDNEPLLHPLSTGPDALTPVPPTVVTRDHVAMSKGSHAAILLNRIMLKHDGFYRAFYSGTTRAGFFKSEVEQTDYVRNQYAVTDKLLESIGAFCKEKDVPLAVVSIPQLFQVLAGSAPHEGDGVDVGIMDDRFSAIAQAQGFHWIKTLPQLIEDYRTHGQDQYYRLDGHFNPRGNRIVVEAIADEIKLLLEP